MASPAASLVGTWQGDSLVGGSGNDVVQGGGAPNDDYVHGLTDLSSGGVHIVGYVSTDWGRRDIAEVKDEIALYRDHYQVGGQGVIGGIFLDEAATDVAAIAYYRDLYDYITGLGLDVILNPGAQPDPQY